MLKKEREKTLLQIVPAITRETFKYRTKVQELLSSQIEPVDFKSYRVSMGIYEQRISGDFMIRIRIGGGITSPKQIRRIAELSENYGNSMVHITTRQDIQLHNVNIEDTPDILEELLQVGLSSRGGGGNTVRNVTACPRAGSCPNEKFDVAPYAVSLTEFLLSNKGSFNLPRKYKLVFSGCQNDCSLASVADLGFFAKIKDGKKGFSVYAAGGLGRKPNAAVKLEDFIEAYKIYEVAEAIRKLFDKLGDRKNRHKARLRYVLKRLGKDEFIKQYRQHLKELKETGLPVPKADVRIPDYEKGQDEDIKIDGDLIVFKDKQAGFATLKIPVLLGDISAKDLKTIAAVSDKYSKGFIHTSQTQDLLITSIPIKDLQKAADELKENGIELSKKHKNKIISCTGASTCKLGICPSKQLAKKLAKKFKEDDIDNDTIIRISGCPNSCAQHYLSNLGLQGRRKRINGKSVNCYDIFTGANIEENNTKLADRIATVPEKNIPELFAKIFKNDISSKAQLLNVVNKFKI